MSAGVSDLKNKASGTAEKAGDVARAAKDNFNAVADDAQARASATARQAGDVFQDARDTATAAADEARKQAASAFEQAKTTAQATASEAVGRAKELADAGKNAGADAMADIAHTMQGAAAEIESQAPGAAKIARSVAESMEHASHDLRDSSIDQIAAGISSFARRQPIGALCGAFVAGVVVARLLGNQRSA